MTQQSQNFGSFAIRSMMDGPVKNLLDRFSPNRKAQAAQASTRSYNLLGSSIFLLDLPLIELPRFAVFKRNRLEFLVCRVIYSGIVLLAFLQLNEVTCQHLTECRLHLFVRAACSH